MRVEISHCLVGLLLAAGCRFEVTGLQIAESPDLSAVEPQDLAEADLTTPDLLGADLRRSYDLFGLPDGTVPGVIGFPCTLAGDCDTGFCIDGYCCESACDPQDPANLCRACNVSGFEGLCVNAVVGTDPRSDCAEESTATCGKDGLCDGNGGCRKWAAATPCGNPVCAAGTLSPPGTCNGSGTCVPSPSVTCSPYDCGSASTCATTCTGMGAMDGNGCASGVPCTVGSCGKRNPGQMCSLPTDCASGVCAQGVCCSTACNGLCEACNLAGSLGTCSAVPAGFDPLNQCTPTNRSSCGDDGTCNGARQCRKWPSGTLCGNPGCMGDSAVPARTCDGAGTCQPAAPMSCGKYTCDPFRHVCFTACFLDLMCASGLHCKPGGMCK